MLNAVLIHTGATILTLVYYFRAADQTSGMRNVNHPAFIVEGKIKPCPKIWVFFWANIIKA